MRVRFGECELDTESVELYRSSKAVMIQAKPFLLLAYLIRHRDRVVSKDELLKELWHGTVVSEAAVRRALKVVRKAIGDDGTTQSMLRTLRGRGYRFVADVETVRTEADPIVPTLEQGLANAFVGRGSLLAEAARALERVAGNEGGLLLYSGEPGIGKTRLLGEVASAAEAAGFEAYRGTCLEREGTPSYLPWRQILRRLIAQRGEESVERVLGEAVSDLFLIDPRLSSVFEHIAPPAPLPHDEAAFCLSDTLANLLRRLAADRPIFLSLDDLHWSDLGSLQLLRHLAAECADAPVLLAGSYRPFEARQDSHRSRLLGELERICPGAHTAVGGWLPQEILEFVAYRTTQALPQSVLDEMSQKSGGNPFFVTLLCGMLTGESGELRLRDLHEYDVTGVHEAILLQVERHSKVMLDTLSLAAVAGRTFTRGELLLASEGGGEELSEGLREALESGLIRQETDQMGHYSFVHALVAESLLRAMPQEARADIHARLASGLEQLSGFPLPDRLPEIADHYFRAGPKFLTRAIDASRRAGHSADARASSAEAVMHFERAVLALKQHAGKRGVLCEVLIELGEARTRAHDTVGARASLADAILLARESENSLHFARAAIAYANEISISGYQPESIDLLEEGVRLLSAGSSEPARGTLLAQLKSRLAYTRFLADPPEVRAEKALEAVSMARESGEPHAIATTLRDYHHCLIGAADWRARLKVVDALVQAARATSSPELETWAAKYRVEDVLESGDSLALESACRTQEELARALRMPLFLCHSLHHQVMRLLRAGDFAEVEELAGQGLQLGIRSGNQIAVQFYGVQLWSLRREQGRLHELEAQVLKLIDDHPDDSGWRAALANDYLERGDFARAHALLKDLVDNELVATRSSVNWTTTPALLSEVAAGLGDAERARALYEELRPHDSKHVVVSLSMADFGPVERFLGVCASTFDAALARRHLEAAVAQARREGLSPALMRSYLDLARLLEGEDRDTSRRFAGDAAEGARALGMLSVVRDAERLLER